jgi:hypothetical protein
MLLLADKMACVAPFVTQRVSSGKPRQVSGHGFSRAEKNQKGFFRTAVGRSGVHNPALIC